jgi:predicted ribonuclease YlaK
MNKFYDTSSLLTPNPHLFDEHFIISSISLDEMENIKTSANKDAEVKYQARTLLHLLDSNPDKYTIVHFQDKMLKRVKQFSVTNDLKIIACALDYSKKNSCPIIFVTNDVAQKSLARVFFDKVDTISEEEDDYCGYKEVVLDEAQMEIFYSSPIENLYGLEVNEYLIIRNEAGEIVDKLCWTGTCYRHLNYNAFTSKMFGEVKPIKGDVYQVIATDSLANNKITMLKGPAGTGKTLLSLGYLFNKLEKGQIDKIVVFCNPVATKNSAKLGYYPGTKDAKVLDSQIGNMLSSKLGGRIALEELVEKEKIVLLPMSDIRGYDTTDMRAGVYITEAQNLDITLMKLALQRIGEDCICIIDGDCKTQVDDISFAGANNGMRKASKVFRGNDIYGEVEFKNIYRSKIAQIAEQM